jgi:hypothetical protein
MSAAAAAAAAAAPAQDAYRLTMQTLNDRARINDDFNRVLTEITTGIANLPTEFRQEITQVFVPTNTLQETAVQIVEQPEGEEISIDYTLTSEILCSLAKSDAKHDFGSEMVTEASKYIPNTGAMCIASPEDTFMHAHIYGKPILENYEYINVPINENLDDVFTQRGIQDVYLIVDTYSSGLRDQLVKGKDIINPPVKYFWVENRQTQYDPAGKTHPKSSAGKVLFTNNNKLQYAREIIKTNGILYPLWDVTQTEFDINAFTTKNKLFYSTNTIFQIAEKMTDGSINTRCIMQTPDGKYVVMDKEMSKISKGLFSSITYAALYNKLQVHIDNFIHSRNNAPPADFTDAHHTVAKRLGDQGQALSTLPDKMLLETMDGKGFESSGNHASVSIDRLAIAAALEYRAPIIIYCRYNGTLDIYIRKDKIGNDGYIKQIQEKQKIAEIEKYKVMHDRIFTGGKTIDTIISEITTYNNSITELKQTLTTTITTSDIGTTNDSYKIYIKNIFSALININMKTFINPPDNSIKTKEEIVVLTTLSDVKKEVAKLEQLESIQKQLVTFTVPYDIANDKLNNKKINEIRLFTQIRASRALETLGDTICGGSYLSFIVDELLKKQYTELYTPFKAKLESIFDTIRTTYTDEQLHTYLIAYIKKILAKLPTEGQSIQALIRNEERDNEYAEEYPEFIVTHMPLSQFISPNSIFIIDNPVQPQAQEPAVTGGKQIQKGGYNEIESIYELKDIQKLLAIILLYASQHNIKVEGISGENLVQDTANTIIDETIIKNKLIQYFNTNLPEQPPEQPPEDIEQYNSKFITYINAIEYEIYKYSELKSLYNYITNIIESKRYIHNTTYIILNKRLSYIILNEELTNEELTNEELIDEHLFALNSIVEKYTIPLFFQSIVHDLIYKKDGNNEERELTVNSILERNIYEKILTKSNKFRQLMKYYNILDLINHINNLGRYNQKYIEYNEIIVTTSQPAQLIDEYKKLSQTELANKKETIIKKILNENKGAPNSNLARLKEQQGEEEVCRLVKKLKHQTTPNIDTAIDSTQLSPVNKTKYKAAIKFLNNLIQLKNIYLQMHSINLEDTTQDIPIIRPQTLIAVAGGGSKRKSKRSKTKYHRKTTRKRLYLITRRKNRK